MTKEQISIVNKTAEFVKNKFESEGSGHDWWHMQRVLNNSIKIAKKEKGDMFVIQLAALLHDISDFKFNGGDELMGGKLARERLVSQGVDDESIRKVQHIVDSISFKGLEEKNKMKGKDGLIVQDADRLDAVGAIGIARCFAYGGSAEIFFSPGIVPDPLIAFLYSPWSRKGAIRESCSAASCSLVF